MSPYITKKSLDSCLIFLAAGLISLFIYFILPMNIVDFMIETEWFFLVIISIAVIGISGLTLWISILIIEIDRKEYIWATITFLIPFIYIIYYILNRKTIE